MDSLSLLIAALIFAAAASLVSWVWFVMARVEGDLRDFSNFEAIPFEIEPPSRRSVESVRWQIAG